MLADANSQTVGEPTSLTELEAPVGATGYGTDTTATTSTEPYTYDGVLPEKSTGWNWLWIVLIAAAVLAAIAWVWKKVKK